MNFKRCAIRGIEHQKVTEGKLKDHLNDPAVMDFLLSLALCHTLVASQSQNGTLIYRGPSPDEEALVKVTKTSFVILLSN
jgi:magnesium-transporting ATPase (P-type)